MAPAYGITIPDRRRSESHIRHVEKMLEQVFTIDGRSINEARLPESRLVGVCDHFTRLLVAMLRARRIPARGRYGFGTYFNPGYFEDHSLCEYWNAAQSRWVLVDPQFDELWRSRLKIDHDVLDVPRDRFLPPMPGPAAARASRIRPGSALSWATCAASGLLRAH